jgi:DNA replication and repair protein RecF
MTLDQLDLLNFKNYKSLSVAFSSGLNVIVGKNGSGKTNLLDAVYFLSFTKGAISSSDQHYVQDGTLEMVLRGAFTVETKKHDLATSIVIGQKKIFREDGLEYAKLSDHIGKYPVVLVAPDDVDLVRDGSESRRKFFDSLISQLSKLYLENLIRYNHCLKQRNGLLKMFAESNQPDWAMVDVYDEMLIPLGNKINETRKAFITEFLPEFEHHYRELVADETVALAYESSLLTKDFKTSLLETRSKDLALQRTSVGIHRDDFNFSLGGGDLKRLGSQGQQKSFVLAMRLAQAEVLKKHKGFYPILLLDDVFDKLDSQRIEQLLKIFPNFGQIFLTDARPDRTLHLVEPLTIPKKIIHVDQGSITRYE